MSCTLRLPAMAALIVASLLAMPCRVAGQGAYTDHTTPLPEQLAPLVNRLLEVVCQGDADAFLAFLDGHATEAFRRSVPDEAHRQFLHSVYGETRGVEYYGFRTYEPPRAANEHVIVVRDRIAGEWRALVITMDETQPSRLANLRFSPARPPSTLPPEPQLTLEEAMKELDAYVDRLVAADAFSGTVAVAHGGQTIYERAAGVACKSFQVPNNMDTKFNLGSMNKMFTAVAVARLVEQGRLSFDDPISQYVDDSWLPREVTERIKVRQLLNHTSGLGSYFNDTFWKSSRDLYRALDDYKSLIRTETLAFDPGSDWSYSNTAFLLAGVVIERVTGESYFDHVRRYVCEPAGMVNTDSYELDRPVPNLAQGYIPQFNGQGRVSWKNNLFLHVIKGGPAGGGYSTARDLLRFDAALRGGQLVSPSMVQELWRPRPEERSPDYGYGFAIAKGPLGKVVGHGGGFPGINSQLDMYLDAGYTVAVLSNYDGGASGLAQKISRLLARIEPGPAPR